MSTVKKQTKWLRDNSKSCTPFRDLVSLRVSSWDPFYVYFTERDDTRHLIKSILQLRYLELRDSMKGKKSNDEIFNQEKKLQGLFESIKGDHLRWQWPINKGRNVNDPDAPTPPIDELYCIPTDACMDEDHSASSQNRNYFVRKIWLSIHKNRSAMTNIDRDRIDEDHEKLLKQDESESLEVFTTLALGQRVGKISPSMDVIILPMISKQSGTLLPEGFDEAWSTHRKGLSTTEHWFMG